MSTEQYNLIPIKLLKPDNLDLNVLIKDNRKYIIPQRRNKGSKDLSETSGKIIRKYIPTLYYIIHKVIVRSYSDDDTVKHKYHSNYIRIYSRDTEPLKTKNDSLTLVTLLRNLNIIDVLTETENNIHRDKANAYYVKLKDKYNFFLQEHQVLIPEHKAIKINDFLKEINEKKIIIDSTDEVLKHQYQAIRKLNFETKNALAHLIQMQDDGQIEKSSFNNALIAISNITNQRIIFTKSTKCNRIFTTVTSMPKILRQFMKDSKGNSLIELDFTAFNAYALYRFIRTLSVDYLAQIGVGIKELQRDLAIYQNLLLDDDFYTSFKDYVFTIAKVTRDEFKKKFLIEWLNAKPNSSSDFKKAIDRSFPQIARVLDAIKQDKYNSLSINLMKLESELVNYTIYKKFVGEYPQAVIYTIFDCIMIQPELANSLKILMIKEGSKFFGVSCKVK